MKEEILTAKCEDTILLYNSRGSIAVDGDSLRIRAVGKDGTEKAVALPLRVLNDKELELFHYVRHMADCAYLTQEVNFDDCALQYTHESLFIEKQRKKTAFVFRASTDYLGGRSELFTVNKDGVNNFEVFSLFFGKAFHVAFAIGNTRNFELFYLLMCYVVSGKAVNVQDGYCAYVDGGLSVVDFADTVLKDKALTTKLCDMGVLCACKGFAY